MSETVTAQDLTAEREAEVARMVAAGLPEALARRSASAYWPE
jgi:hypothetical protein